MIQIIFPLLSSLAYSSNVLFAKIALDYMPFTIFLFLVAVCYTVLGIYIYIQNTSKINNYLSSDKNREYIFYAILAIIVGAMLADCLMWYSIKISSKQILPIVITLINSAPIFSLLFVYIFYNTTLDYRAVIGIFISVIGCCIAVYYSDDII